MIDFLCNYVTAVWAIVSSPLGMSTLGCMAVVAIAIDATRSK